MTLNMKFPEVAAANLMATVVFPYIPPIMGLFPIKIISVVSSLPDF
jgi:hypothetical protein